MTLACKDANPKLIEVVTVADVDDVDRVAGLVIKLNFCSDFAHKVLSIFWS